LLFVAAFVCSLFCLVRRRRRLMSLNAQCFLRRSLLIGNAGRRPLLSSRTLRKRTLSYQGPVLATLHIDSVEVEFEFEIVYILTILSRRG
jgi:hypothetical protein